MGLEVGVLTALSAGASAVGTIAGIVNNNKAKGEQKKIQAQQNASNKTQQLAEQRKQIREERVRRARIMQAAENTGTSGSSGEAGALSGMSTQLASNMGDNLGAITASQNISGFQQNAADAANTAQAWGAFGQLAPTGIKLGNSIFSSSSTPSSSTSK